MKETLYFGGPILTMVPEKPEAEALLVSDGRIAAAGSLEELKFRAGAPELVDLKGHALMPSFIDAHSHMASMGLSSLRCDLTGCESFDEMLERLSRYRLERGLTHGEPVLGRGYDTALLKEGRHPDASVLDRLGFDNPVLATHRSGHMSACNTRAMELAGIGDGTVFPPGGVAARDEKGRLTGYFEETAQNPLTQAFSAFSEERQEQAILRAQDYYLERGITTIQDGSSNEPQRFACYERLAESGKLKADVVAYITHKPGFEDFWRDAAAKYGGACRNHLKLGGIKLVLDGSPQAKTAWMRKPYEGEESYRGYPIFSDEYVLDALCRAIDAGLQPLAHCNGDAAAEQFLSMWEKAVKIKGRGPELRPVMIHAQTVGYDQLDRMKAVGMMPSFFIGHCWFWGDTHLENFGEERGRRISPVRAAMERGLVCSFHQDCPVTEPDMLMSVWCAVMRLTRSGVCIGPENRIGVSEALACVTRGAAYSYFEENEKGILAPGAFADLVILDRSPLAVPPMEIKDIRILETVMRGERVFSG